MSDTTHIIEKVSVEIDVETVDQAHAIENNIQSFIKDEIIPEVERYFQQVDVPNVHVILDKLSLDFNSDILYSPFWKDELHSQLRKALNSPIAQAKSELKASNEKSEFSNPIYLEKGTEVRSGEKSLLQALSHFITKGKAPWWVTSSGSKLSDFLKKDNFLQHLENQEFSELLLRLIKEQPSARKRLVLQFEDSIQLKVFAQSRLKASSKKLQDSVAGIPINSIPFIKNLSKSDRDYFWFNLHTFASNPSSFNSINTRVTFLLTLANHFSSQSTSVSTSDLYQYLKTVLENKEVKSNDKVSKPVEKSIKSSKKDSKTVEKDSKTENKSKKSTKISAIDNTPPLPPILALGIFLVAHELTNNSISQLQFGKIVSFNSSYFRLINSEVPRNNVRINWEAMNTLKSSLENLPNDETIDEMDSKTSRLESSSDNANSVSELEQELIKQKESPKEEITADSDEVNLQIEKEKNLSMEDKAASESKNSEDTKKESDLKVMEDQLEKDWNKDGHKGNDLKEGIYTKNAGAILLHPFLSPLFQNLGYLDDERQIIEPQRAVHIIHYMATNREQDFEHEMQFAKFLCGVPEATIIEREIELNEKEKSEANSVLKSVLTHWTALKSNSPEALQYGFLQREGKIFSDDGILRVVIEKNTIDILINQLPWNISMVRLPWIVEMVHVEWG